MRTTDKRKRPARRLRTSRPATLRPVALADLQDQERLERLYRRAVDDGLLVGTEAERLNVFAAAWQALAKGEQPERLFAWIINGKRWEVLTDAADDGARAMLKPRRKTPRGPYEGEPVPEPTPFRDVLARAMRGLFHA